MIGGVVGRRLTGRGDVGAGGGGGSAKASVTRTLVRLGGGGMDRLGGGEGASSVTEPAREKVISQAHSSRLDTYHSCQAVERVEAAYPATPGAPLRPPSAPEQVSWLVARAREKMVECQWAWTGD